MKPKIDNEFKIDDHIANRWSGRAYSDQQVEKETLMSLFEAARWAPSAFNEQPWQFYVGIKGDTQYEAIAGTLVEFNHNWAQHAPVLLLVGSRKTYAKNQKPNIHSWYDTGQAVGNLSLQATKLNLNLHQMAGYDSDKAQVEIIKDENIESVCVIAIGYRGEPEVLSDELKEREEAPQTRNSFEEFLFFAD